ncbi:MAG: SDR family oxidoreductase [Gammaproteobacteria bacterium]|nr:MAG: SDR family oxidoreductase [Gammaproteobacteria bacterium]
MDWSRQTVLITGASSGIGRALALELDRRGARLVLAARRLEALEAVRAACSTPARHHLLALDLEDADALPARAAEAERLAGPIDILVNNAGLSLRGRIAETDIAVDRRIMEVNYFGSIGLTKALLPGMLARGRGQVVVVSSIVGHISTPMRSAYAASKHALHGWFDALRAEVHDQGIRVTLVLPGYINTDISLNALCPDGRRHGRMDRNQAGGLPAEYCARRMAEAIARGRAEVIVSRPYERFGRWLGRHWPALFRIIVRREQPK